MTKYYCENCMEEDLKHYVEDDIGAIFCSDKCFREFEGEIINGKEYWQRHKIVKRR